MDLIRVLFLSDTHLGFDSPRSPRVERRRRGPDFFANFERALEPARRGDVDLVVHGGDVFYRSKIPPGLVARAFQPLKEIAERGIPVYVVPGNHERSRIPYPLLAQHPGIFVFDRPRTFRFRHGGCTVALAGFPYARSVRASFSDLIEATEWRQEPSTTTLLLVHHAFEGARVGPADFTFGAKPDVIRPSDIPSKVTAVLSGHIHRAQALVRARDGTALPAPILYPGSIERTSFAEKEERKGYLTLAIEPNGHLRGWRFHELPSRPMIRLELGAHTTLQRLRQRLRDLPPDAVVRLEARGAIPEALSAASVRALTPDTMNVSLSLRAPRP